MHRPLPKWVNRYPRLTTPASPDVCYAPLATEISQRRDWSHLYRALNLVERFFNKIKRCRRVATRYDKLAANYLAFVQLASILLWLRVYESTA